MRKSYDFNEFFILMHVIQNGTINKKCLILNITRLVFTFKLYKEDWIHKMYNIIF